ncbi:MAG: terminase large subunit [Sphingomonadales bacterium]|nr:terminase large subunit [Sphingomonadales bacterium]MDE2171188.1 terminase large subunit [Sphingomonadales bacterium]
MALTWSTACPDWEARIIAGQSLLPCPPLFPQEAEDALQVFRDLPIVDVMGKPSFGEISRDWVYDLPSAVFGAYNPDTGRREINTFFELISKKNTKSTRAAGIMITELVRNQRYSAEFNILAPTLEVAKNSAEPAMDMVAEHPDLRRILKPIAHERKIVHRETGAFLKIVAADSETVSGKKTTGLLIDELWLFGKRANAKNMLREAMGGLASRPEGFVIALTTQSDEPPAGVMLDWVKRFRDIRDGKLAQPRALGLLYEFPEAMIKAGQHLDPANFFITNPNLGASVDIQFLLDQFEEAQREGPKSLVGFCAKHLNVEPGMGARSDSWAGAEFWKKRADPSITLDSIIERCEVIVVGIDGGGMDDLFGLTVLGRTPNEIEVEQGDDPDDQEPAPRGKKRVKQWLSWSHAWAHDIVLERRKSIAPKLQDLQAAGELTILPDDAMDDQGVPLDIAQIVEIIVRIRDAGLLYCVAADPAGLGELVDALADVDITEENKDFNRDFVAGVSQSYGMMNAIKTGERKLANGTFLHADQPLMDWCVSNLKIEPTATAIRATKQHAGDAKIDPAMAKFNAITIMATNPPACRSIYEERGLLIL